MKKIVNLFFDVLIGYLENYGIVLIEGEVDVVIQRDHTYEYYTFYYSYYCKLYRILKGLSFVE